MERDFKGVWIPKEIYLDTRLSALDKIILTEIHSLDGGEGCYASNKYLAEFCQCSEAKVTKSVSMLIELGYLYVEKFDGRRRFLKACLVKSTRQTRKKYEADSENLRHINIYNNIDNNTSITNVIEEQVPPKYGNSEINELFDEWEKHCGFKIDTKVQKNRYACQRLIKSRGIDRVKRAIPYVAQAQADQYAPSINNFMDLAEKWNNLAVWYKRKTTSEFMNNGKIVIPDSREES